MRMKIAGVSDFFTLVTSTAFMVMHVVQNYCDYVSLHSEHDCESNLTKISVFAIDFDVFALWRMCSQSVLHVDYRILQRSERTLLS